LPSQEDLVKRHHQQHPQEEAVMFIENLAKNAQTSVVYQWEKFLRNLPFRMAIGKFGIWLTKVGRYLQVNYADWNSEFRLKVKYVPNPDMCCIPVSEIVTTQQIRSNPNLSSLLS
jgi:hypothetical protein